ncbi:MAG: hypothetical protein N2V75_05675 [Methanophagales archaeon]|nr:hypothetical protein [Methanophagales archaeon]
MKRATILVVATAMVLSIAFSGVALASQPVCPTPETENIKTTTQISCQGMVTEMEQVSWESSNEDLINNPPLGIEEVVGKMDYYQDLKVTDGVTNFIKDMDVDTGAVPNLNVMKSIGYSQGTTIGSLSHTEEVSFGVVGDYAPTAEVILCPFAAAAETLIPASCEDVKASSSMVVTDVLATTVSKVGISESPLDFHYAIDATGSGGAGTPGVGHITAEYEVYVEDGSSGMGDHCGKGDPETYTLGSKLTHKEKSTADGLWEFHKEMDYTSKIRPVS